MRIVLAISVLLAFATSSCASEHWRTPAEKSAYQSRICARLRSTAGDMIADRLKGRKLEEKMLFSDDEFLRSMSLRHIP